MSALDGHRAVGSSGGGLDVKGSQHRNPTHGRQGKRPAFDAAYVVGKIEEFTSVTNTGCWRFLQIMQTFQGFDRRRAERSGGAAP
jgi:hypothetical protein